MRCASACVAGLGLVLLVASGCSREAVGPTTADFQKQRAQVVEKQKQMAALQLPTPHRGRPASGSASLRGPSIGSSWGYSWCRSGCASSGSSCSGRPTPRSWLHFGYTLVGVAYFTIMEGILGCSVGKALLGLRVLAVDGSQPGLGRALVRGILFVLAMRVPSFFGGPEGVVPAHPPFSFDLSASGAGLTLGFDVTDYWYVGLVILFVTMRRRNGFSGLHDFLTRTRVVVGSTQETPKVAPGTADALSGTAPIGRIGPYQVVEHLNDRLLRGYMGDSVGKCGFVSTLQARPPCRRSDAISAVPDACTG